MTIRRRAIPLLLAFGVLIAWSLPSAADVLDLTTAGAEGFINGAFVTTTQIQPTGTGVIDPFLRLQANGSERGYNTDFRPVEFDEKQDLQYTHSLLLADVPTVTFGGTTYLEFLLDINEPDGAQTYLSLDELQIILGPTGSETGYSEGPPPSIGDATEVVFDLDSGLQGEATTILTNYTLNPGSGGGDLFFYIPAPEDPENPYLYLFSEFGTYTGNGSNWHSGDGFEEWAVREAEQQVPEPGTAMLLFFGIAGAIGLRRRF